MVAFVVASVHWQLCRCLPSLLGTMCSACSGPLSGLFSGQRGVAHAARAARFCNHIHVYGGFCGRVCLNLCELRHRHAHTHMCTVCRELHRRRRCRCCCSTVHKATRAKPPPCVPLQRPCRGRCGCGAPLTLEVSVRSLPAAGGQRLSCWAHRALDRACLEASLHSCCMAGFAAAAAAAGEVGGTREHACGGLILQACGCCDRGVGSGWGFSPTGAVVRVFLTSGGRLCVPPKANTHSTWGCGVLEVPPPTHTQSMGWRRWWCCTACCVCAAAFQAAWGSKCAWGVGGWHTTCTCTG